jgi:hypothetical protein
MFHAWLILTVVQQWARWRLGFNSGNTCKRSEKSDMCQIPGKRAWLLSVTKEFELERKVAVEVPTESACLTQVSGNKYDIRRYYDFWSARGAKFITEPKAHATELWCYMRDPDGYLIEVGQTTMITGPLDL